MDNTTAWWILSGALVALELITGSFYLLMLALGLAAGAVAAHAGWALQAQLLSAALVGAAAVGAWYAYLRRKPGDGSVRGLRSVNLDVGEVLHIGLWQADGSAQVKYRGALWQVAMQQAEIQPTPGSHRVVELRGNRLMVEKI